jgi:hypothetical protein
MAILSALPGYSPQTTVTAPASAGIVIVPVKPGVMWIVVDLLAGRGAFIRFPTAIPPKKNPKQIAIDNSAIPMSRIMLPPFRLPR